MAQFRHAVALIGAHCHAAAAANTLSRIVIQLLTSQLGFRIVAPKTIQRTTFEKNSGTDTRTIVNAEFLDIEDRSHNTPPHLYSNIASRRPKIQIFLA
jgi:hypothetical protein